MNKTSKIYVAGHTGLVGSAIVRQLTEKGFTKVIKRSHAQLDLTRQVAVEAFFSETKPDYVILAAAKVGGIHANNTYPADFIYENLLIEANVIRGAYNNGVKRLLFMGSTCVYPKSVAQPMREDALLTGVLESTNEPYAIAKIAGIKLCESYNRQYQTDYRSVMPTNLYGPNDNFHMENSHVIPAIMRKIHLAKCMEQNNWQVIRKDIVQNPINDIDDRSDQESIVTELEKHGIYSATTNQSSGSNVTVKIWGTGNARRDFLHVDDMASASLFVLKLDEKTYHKNTEPMLSHINIGTDIDVTIKEVAEKLQKMIGFGGRLIFDSTKSDGTPRKLVDSSRLSGMGWRYRMDLEKGLEQTYRHYQEQYD